MNKYYNEKGMALVTTLLFITVILLLLLSQFYLVTNSTKQISTMEKSMAARHMAEMGIDYYKQFILSKSDEIVLAAEEDPDVGLDAMISKIIDLDKSSKRKIIIEGDNRSFEIDKNISVSTVGDDRILIEFTSKGFAFDRVVDEPSEIQIVVQEN